MTKEELDPLLAEIGFTVDVEETEHYSGRALERNPPRTAYTNGVLVLYVVHDHPANCSLYSAPYYSRGGSPLLRNLNLDAFLHGMRQETKL